MYLLTESPKTIVELIWDRPLKGNALELTSQLRGAISHAFAENDYFHQHDKNGKVIYRYPKIQYRWSKGHGLIVGWKDAAQILANIPWLDLQLSFKQAEVCSTDAIIEVTNSKFGISDRLLHYVLRSPLLLFNQKNFAKYQDMNLHARIYEQDRLLTAQILTALRGLDVQFSDRMYATIASFRPVQCKYKGERLMGILGRIATNASLPDGFAIGHAVSHGHGWLQPITHEMRK